MNTFDDGQSLRSRSITAPTHNLSTQISLFFYFYFLIFFIKVTDEVKIKAMIERVKELKDCFIHTPSSLSVVSRSVIPIMFQPPPHPPSLFLHWLLSDRGQRGIWPRPREAPRPRRTRRWRLLSGSCRRTPGCRCHWRSGRWTTCGGRPSPPRKTGWRRSDLPVCPVGQRHRNTQTLFF